MSDLLFSGIKKIEEQELKVTEEQEKLADTYILKAQMLKLEFKFEDAAENFEKAVSIYDSWRTRFAAGCFYYSLNDFEKAEKYLRTVLEKSKDDIKNAMTVNNFSSFLKNANQYDDALTAHFEKYGNLAHRTPRTYLPQVAMTLTRWGALLNNTNDYAAAQIAYRRALETFRTLAPNTLQIYLPHMGTTLNNLAVLLKDTNDYAAAKTAFMEALNIRRTLVRVNPKRYSLDVADTLNNLLNLLRDTNDHAALQTAFTEALDNFKEYLSLGKELSYENLILYFKAILYCKDPNIEFYELNQHYNRLRSLIVDYLDKISHGESITEDEKNISKLMIYQSDFKIGFGNYDGSTIQDIINYDSHYILWCIINLLHFSISLDLFLDENLKIEYDYLEALEINLIKIELLDMWTKQNDEQYWDNDYGDYNNYSPSYKDYGGAYGYDDYTINSAFEGDPENYWNID